MRIKLNGPDDLSYFAAAKKSGLPPIRGDRMIYLQTNGRSFNEIIFHAKHINGTQYKREWMIYSESSDSVCHLLMTGKTSAEMRVIMKVH